MDRRSFLQTVTAAAGASLLAACEQKPQVIAEPARLERIGVGLFTVPQMLDQDFAGAMKTLAEIGYKEVEFFGPYTYSVPEVHERWAPIAESIGMKQSGYFGHTPQQVRTILDENGLTSPSMHADMKTLQTRLDDVAEAAQTLGQRYAGIAAIQPDQRTSLDDYKRVADEFNALGSRMKEVGLTFLYHNHGYGLVEMEGEIPFNVLIERTDPDLVALEMDVYWMTAGRADPVAYLEAYPGRFALMHLKDMTEVVHFAGDGGDPSQWIELFPHMTDAGSGVLDLSTIITQARTSGAQHFYLERDLAADEIQTLKNSHQYLSSLTFDS